MKEEMVSRSPPPSKWGRREDEDESRRGKKLEKGKEPVAKDAVGVLDRQPTKGSTRGR
jgi:hypothetical protein